jgi:glycosyltransferase involved in cell wall biosynthesis
MNKNRLDILQINAFDVYGGAEKIAWELFKAYQQRGHGSWLAVGRKLTQDDHVLEIPKTLRPVPWARLCQGLHDRLIGNGNRTQALARLCGWLRIMAQGIPAIQHELGWEDFNFPGARKMLQLTPQRADIIHAHNLHANYFDLRYLPGLSHAVPLIVHLHDAWLLSGHCAHSFECDRWIIGCGTCPDLTIYPGIKRDATAWNWRRKKKIYARSRLYIATPCNWLMDKARKSMLMTGAQGCRVIPNGVDLAVFHPGEKQAARAELGIDQAAKVLLFAAHGIRDNIWKDYHTLRKAVALTDAHLQEGGITFIALGEDAPPERIGTAEVCFVPPQQDPRRVACYYRAADIYVHAARADTFPNTILESLACGTPVIATAVGGIPEQIIEGVTGFLVAPGDSMAMAHKMAYLLNSPDVRLRMGQAAAEDAKARFNLDKQASKYIQWYQEIIDQQKKRIKANC